MKYTQFLDEIKNKKHRLYFLYGEETFLKERALSYLLSSYATNLPEFNVDVLRDFSLQALETACETLPMMAGHRIVVARFTAKMENIGNADLQFLDQFLQKFSETTVLVLYAEDKLDARKAFFKLVSSHCAVGEFPVMAQWEAAQWVEKEASNENKPISSNDARYFVSLVGSDLSALHNELEKLLDYCSGRISRKDIDFIVTKSVEYNVFHVMDDLEQNKNSGWSGLKTLMATEEVPKIIGAMASRFRLMLRCREYLAEGMRETQVLQKMKGGYGARQALGGCRSFSLDRLKEAMLLLSGADYDIKNGIRKDKAALEETVLKIYRTKG